MNAKNLNTSFWFLSQVFSMAITQTFLFLVVVFYNNFYLTASALLLNLIAVVLVFVSFVKDRKTLWNAGAFVPSGVWILFMPIYVYKRQKRNNLGMKWFWLYIVMSISYTGFISFANPL